MANYKTEAMAYELADELARRTGLPCAWGYVSGVPTVRVGETRVKFAGGIAIQIQDQRGESDGGYDPLPGSGFGGSQPVYTTGVAKVISEALVDVSVATAFATSTLTFTGVSIAGETVTIDGIVLTARAAPANENEFLVGGDAALSATALRACINAHSILKGVVVASGTAGAVVLTAKQAGVAGNSITVAEGQTNTAAWSNTPTLAGGAGVSFGSVANATLQMKVWGALAKRGIKLELWQTINGVPPMSDATTIATNIYFQGEFFPNEFWPLSGQA